LNVLFMRQYPVEAVPLKYILLGRGANILLS
jgi:hypothetical protein